MFEDKYEKLVKTINDAESAVVAFSGGVDSTVLAKVAFDALGDKALAVTLDSETIPRRELEEAEKTAEEIGINHVILPHSELVNERFVDNPPDRCFHCKKELSLALKDYAKKKGFKAVLEGTNASELCGHRPGYKALQEEGVLSPLSKAGLTKEEVRKLAHKLGLPNSDKPASACLSSRIPYGQKITAKSLNRVEKAEDAVKDLGIAQVRVRAHGDVARIEVEEGDMDIILVNRKVLAENIRKVGFKYVAVDLLGYRSGSMNE